MQLTELRKELRFSVELVQLIETLKNVAASQYHVMEKEKHRFERFMDSFAEFFRVVDLVKVENPLVKVESDVLGVVIVTSDSGFMGGLNQGVIKAAMAAAADLPESRKSFVVLGDKGAGMFSDQRREFKYFHGVNQGAIYELAAQVKEYIVREVIEGRMGKVIVAYPRPLSFSAQTIEVVNLLPCAELFDRNAESAIAGRGRMEKFVGEAAGVVVESSFADIVEYLAGVWVTSKLFEILEDSKLAEYSARAMHLEGSFQKLEKDLKKIKHQCFKATHEQIDKGMRESFAAKGGRKKRKPEQT